MKSSIKSIAIATLLATSAPVAALAQAEVDASGGASSAAEGAGANAGLSGNAGVGQNGSPETYGQLISRIQSGEVAETEDFTDYEIGTDGDVEIVALSELNGEGAENGQAALENAIGTGVNADYSQLPDGIFDGTSYVEDDVKTVFLDAGGNLVVVVDGPA